MLDKLPALKAYLLPAFVALLLVLSYPFAFKKTMEAWQLNRELSLRAARASDLSVQPSYLERQQQNLSRALDLFRVDSLNYRSRLLQAVGGAAEAEKVRILELPEEPLNAYYLSPLFSAHRISFEGDYFALERLLARLDTLPSLGFLRSAEFKAIERHTALGTVKALTLQVYLEALR
jgi:hypothetical protein